MQYEIFSDAFHCNCDSCLHVVSLPRDINSREQTSNCYVFCDTRVIISNANVAYSFDDLVQSTIQTKIFILILSTTH